MPRLTAEQRQRLKHHDVAIGLLWRVSYGPQAEEQACFVPIRVEDAQLQFGMRAAEKLEALRRDYQPPGRG